MRVAVYARYSSNQQTDRSLADQVRLCKTHAEQQNWTVVQVYEDAAISGATTHQRPAYRQMLEAAAHKQVDAVLAESLDRLSRRLADTAQLHDELSFHRVKLITVHQGEITQLHVGMLGTVAQIYLSDLRDKTRRGLAGRISAGRSAGGLAYGYRAVAGDLGAREIEPTQAETVRRIFQSFAAGHSPRAIAARLNAEAVPGPGGRRWNDTTIRGQRPRGTGLLNNDLYVGRLVWNRCAYVKDPRTGKRLARPNPPALWQTEAVPALRIVDEGLWEAVKRRQDAVQFEIARDESGNALNRVHRKRYLLSGVLVCGACGGAFTIIGRERYGCAAHKRSGTCSNTATIDRGAIEARVLRGLRDHLLTPDLVAAVAQDYARELQRITAAQKAQRSDHVSQRDRLARQIDRIVDAVADGQVSSALLGRLEKLEAQKAGLDAELAAAPAPPTVITEGFASHYRRKVDALIETLNAPELRAEAGERLRAAIDKVVLAPDAENGFSAELHGDLAGILALGAEKQKPADGGAAAGQISVVAGARNRRCQQGLFEAAA